MGEYTESVRAQHDKLTKKMEQDCTSQLDAKGRRVNSKYFNRQARNLKRWGAGNSAMI